MSIFRICHYCGKRIGHQSKINHTNIKREIQVYHFCTRECKISWCIQESKRYKFLNSFFDRQKKRFPEEKVHSL